MADLSKEMLSWLNLAKAAIEQPRDLYTESIVDGKPLTTANDTNVTIAASGTPLTSLIKPVLLTMGWSGTLAPGRGGTGISSYAVGDLLYASGATTLSKLADVAAGSYLRSGGVTTAPLWSTLTLPNAATTGDLPYASASNTVSMLADVAAGSYLRSGGVTTAPLWSTLILPNAANSGDILKASSANTLASVAPSALTKADDTNVTLTLGGSATTALVNAASITAGWTGLLGLARGGTHADLSATGGAKNYLKQASVGADITVGTIPASDIGSGAALTKTDDTNVTLTLGGTPSTALLVASSLTLGWTGTLAVARGGIGVGTLASNGVLYGNGTSAVLALAVNASATRKFLSQTSSAAPAWNTVDGADVTGSHTLADSVLSTNVPLLNAANAFTQDNSFKTVNANIARSNSAGAGSIYFGPGGAASEWNFRDDTTDAFNLDYYNGSAWTAGLLKIDTTGAATLLGDLTVHATTSGSKVITLGGAPSTNAAAAISLVCSNTQFNWRIAANSLGAGVFDISPSTATGGSTFSVPGVLSLTSTTLTINGVGSHAFTGGANSAQELQITNTTSGTAAYAGFRATAGTNIDLVVAFSQGYTTSGVNIQSSMLLQSTGAGGLTLAATDGAGIIRLYTGGSTLRWGVNAAGDWTFGTSAHLADSSGTPAIGASLGTGTPTIAGTDYAMVITASTSNTRIDVTFGHTFSTTPIVVISVSSASVLATEIVSAVSTTGFSLGDSVNPFNNGAKIYILVRGY